MVRRRVVALRLRTVAAAQDITDFPINHLTGIRGLPTPTRGSTLGVRATDGS